MLHHQPMWYRIIVPLENCIVPPTASSRFSVTFIWLPCTSRGAAAELHKVKVPQPTFILGLWDCLRYRLQHKNWPLKTTRIWRLVRWNVFGAILLMWMDISKWVSKFSKGRIAKVRLHTWLACCYWSKVATGSTARSEDCLSATVASSGIGIREKLERYCRDVWKL